MQCHLNEKNMKNKSSLLGKILHVGSRFKFISSHSHRCKHVKMGGVIKKITPEVTMENRIDFLLFNFREIFQH